MTPPNVILGLAIQELATKLAYAQARRERVASALASLDKLAGASELGTQQLGGSPGFDPMKRPPPPKLGKPIPTPSSSSTTKRAEEGCDGKPKRGIEPELTEKLRQDAEAQTPMPDADAAAKVAATKAERLMMQDPELLAKFLRGAVEHAGGPVAVTPAVAQGAGRASAGALPTAERLKGLRGALRDIKPAAPAEIKADAARRAAQAAEEAAAADARRQYQKMLEDAARERRVNENARKVKQQRHQDRLDSDPEYSRRYRMMGGGRDSTNNVVVDGAPGSKAKALALSTIPAAYLGIMTPGAVEKARNTAKTPAAADAEERGVYRTMLPGAVLGSLGAAVGALAPTSKRFPGATASMQRVLPAARLGFGGMTAGLLGGTLYHGLRERADRDATKVAVSKDWLRRGVEAPRRALDTALEVGSIGRPGPGASDIAALRTRLADLGDRLADSQHPLAQYAQGIADTEGAVLRGMHRDLVNPRVGWRL